ncbi:MAG: LysM peptidoglycan-binding domain-containing protein [Marmoricola sp.]
MKQPRIQSYAAKPAPATESYTTRAHDSLWKIAEAHLGDGTRFTEIVDLNPDLFPDGPGFLTAGTVLQLPASEASAAVDPEDSPYVVEPGDTLWDIADEELGDPTRYDEIFEASDDIVQPDGRTLTDPDLIYPGWELEIPDRRAARHDPAGDHARRSASGTSIGDCPDRPSGSHSYSPTHRPRITDRSGQRGAIQRRRPDLRHTLPGCCPASPAPAPFSRDPSSSSCVPTGVPNCATEAPAK